MSDTAAVGLIDRTLRNLRSAWTELSDSTRYYLSGAPRPDLPGDDLAKMRQQMLEQRSLGFQALPCRRQLVQQEGSSQVIR